MTVEVLRPSNLIEALDKLTSLSQEFPKPEFILRGQQNNEWKLCMHIPRISATQSMGKLPPSPREACHVDHGKVATQARRSLPPRSVATLGRLLLFCGCSSCQPCLPFPHGVALQGNLVGVMHQAVEDRVGQRGIPQGLMPVLDW